MISELFAPLIEFVKAVVAVYGGLGVFLAMIIQAILVVIPSEGVLLAAGALMPLWTVTLWASLGSITGASISFMIAKKGGRPIVKRLLGKDTVHFMDHWVKKWGGKGVLIGRLIPFVPYDPISYLSGVTEMEFKKFTLFNAIGTVPRVIMFALMGSIISAFEWIGLVVVIGLIVGLITASIYFKKKMINA